MYRQNIQFPPKDAPLREDVHALGALVGEILFEQCGEGRFDLVEGDRVAAIARREGVDGAETDLLRRTASRQPDVAKDLVRAFSTWFQVVNLAENVHRIRRRREYLNDASQTQPGGLEEAIRRLARDGRSLEDVLLLLRRMCIYPVFTAHPTESTRRTILRKQARIADLLLDRLDRFSTPRERRATWEQVRTELTSGWQTEDHPRERLNVGDEREHVLFFLSEVLYRIVPGFYEELAAALSKVFESDVHPESLPRILRFGSWVGGDMDGASDINAKTIRESLHRHHLVVVNAYFLEVQRLGERLSQSASRVAVAPALAQRIADYEKLVPSAHESAPARHDRMPYRQFCAQIAERLRNTYEGRPHHYENVGQFMSDVQLMADSLSAHKGANAGLFHVRRFIRRIDTFGMHLAALDVRQHADVHRAVVGQGLGDPDFCRRSSEERQAIIRRALEAGEGPSHPLDVVGRRALAVFEQLVHARHRYGAEAIGEYVVSGATGADDVMAVLLLARWAEMIDKKTGEVPLDVAPLFESVATLERCSDVVMTLFSEPVYRRHLSARDDRQGVMLGYGDSNKDSGFAASRWALHRAQADLAATARREGVTLTAFHGRGGATSRGTSRIATLVRSAPPGSFEGVLRVTEQGGVVNQSYALRPIALRTLEQAFNAASQALVPQESARLHDAASIELMQLIASESRSSYRRFVRDTPGFWDYFREVTPIDVIERMQIGSRPTSRAGSEGIDALRSVPWTFAWSQARHLLPSWFGMGAGLDAAAAVHGQAALEQMSAHFPFFSLLLDETEFALAVADMEIASWYSRLASKPLRPIFELVLQEHARTEAWVLKLRGQRRLLDGEPGLQRGMKLRNPYVDPMHLMQVDLLARWRATGREDRVLLDALIASIGGIAQGLQATG